MIQLSVKQNDNDYMYSFSDREGYYHWQKDPISKFYGQNQVVYVSVMSQDGSISKERKVELSKLDLFQPEVNVAFEETNGNVVFTVDATDNLSGVKEYSFDGGTTYQTSNQFIVKDNKEISIHVKDYAGNTKVYEKTYSVDANEETSVYSLTDKMDEEGNRYHEVTVENASNQYEYNLDENKWSNETTQLIPYEKEDELVLKRRVKTSKNTRSIVEEETQIMRAISYPRVGGPAIIYEDGMIRLIGQGVAFNYTDTIIDSPTGQYTIEGYNYHVEYSYDLETWTIYDGPFELLPSDYGKTLYSRLVGPNNGYISSEILDNEGVQKLVTSYQEHPSIADAVLTYDQIQDLLAAKYEFNYVAIQFENETNRYQYNVSSKNVIEFALSKNIYRAYENFKHLVATMQSPNNPNVYIFSDLIGNKASYNVQSDILIYNDEDAELIYSMSNGVLNTVTDKNNNVLTITRGDNSTTITDFNGRVYTIDGDGVHMPSGILIDEYSYIHPNTNFHEINVEEPVTITYGTFAGMSVITRLDYESGAYVSYEYSVEDDFYTVVTETTSQGTNKYYYDPRFNMVMEEDKDEYRSHYGYDDETKDLIEENADGIVTRYFYDENGNLTKIMQGCEELENGILVVKAWETVSVFTYDTSNRLISEKHENEDEIRYTYDNKGNLIKVSEVKEETLEEIVTATYDSKGNVLTEIDVDANVQNTYTYDSYNNLTSVTTTDLDDVTNVSVVTYTYDADGRVLSEINEDYTNTYEYNQLGAVLLQKVNNEYTRNVYNDKGQLKVTINHEDYLESEDGLKQTPKSDVYTNTNKGTRYSYTEKGQIKTIISPDDMVTVNVYDENGNLQKESNYNKNNYNAETDNYMYQTVYLTNGLVERYRVNGTTKLLNTYDDKYNLIKVAYGNSQNIQYSYSSESNLSNETNNIDNLLMGVTFKNDSAPRFTYSYDKYGELVETIDVKNNTKTVFNDNGYVISDLSDENNVIQSYTSNDDIITEEVLNQTYTSVFDNDTISLKKNDVNVITSMKEYDSNGEMDSLQTTLSNNNQSVTLTETPTYDKELITNYAIGGINNTTYNFQYTYDEDKNIKKEYGSFINNFYTYDDNNQLIRVIDSINNRTTVFKYDARGNLIKETVYGKNDYADNGNDAAPLNEIIYTYGNGDWQDQLTKVNNDTITYDGAGNRTSYDGWNYTWEGGRQLASMSKGDTSITYKYDDSGIRTEKKVNDKIIRYTTVDGRITSQDDGTNKLYFYYDEYDSLLGFEHNGTPYLYIRNIQGDIYGITDVNGTLLVQYEYDAWGKVKDITGNQTLGQLNPMRYRGYYYDEETGLYYLQSRYYDASVRRFINADVFEMIGNGDSFVSYNLYAYCENNPICRIDRTGMWSFTVTRGMLAFVLDTLASVLGWSVWFSPISTYVSKNLKKLSVKTLVGKAMTLISKVKVKSSSIGSKIKDSVVKTFKWIVGSETANKWGNKVKNIICDMIGSITESKVSKLANKILKNLDVLSSVGNFVAGIVDNYFFDGKLNGIITVVNF